jgi:UDP-galactopyranose mutase
MTVDWLIVGAGYTGCVLAERIASQLDQTVLLVDRRGHVGGNAYDYYNEAGILIHKYGPHIFHTNSQRVWDYLCQFTTWRAYEHRVLAVVEGHKVPVPFNLNSLERLVPRSQAERLEAKLNSLYGSGAHVPILRMLDAEDPDVRGLAELVYKHIFYGYTLKQWGLTPEQLDPSVTGRVPVRISRDDRYFQDTYQAMPTHGYTAMFERMLRHPRIDVRVNTDYRTIAGEVQFNRMIYTGPIDAYFDYLHGPLPYRSLRFDFQTVEREWFQEVGTVNYPNDAPYTRITEFKYLTGQEAAKTSVVTEYPMPHRPGENEPYYPVPREENRERYAHYQKEADRLRSTVLFAGRLADYKYYNMDQAVARALKLFEDTAA